MLGNEGYLEAKIIDASVDIPGRSFSSMLGKGEITFSQNEMGISVSYKYEGSERKIGCRFSKHELGRLRTLFEKGGEFCFMPRRGQGSLRIDRVPSSRDMIVQFGSGARYFVQQDEFRGALKLMKHPLTDLVKIYPQVAQVVDEFVAFNTDLIWAFVFGSGLGERDNIARYCGELTRNQLNALRRVANIPDDIEPTKNGKWVEFRTNESGPFKLLDVSSYEDTGHNWSDIIVYSDTKMTHDLFNAHHVHHFYKGGLSSENLLDLMKRTCVVPSDVFVFVFDEELTATQKDFDEVPLVEVFRESEKHGPYAHPMMDGKTALSIVRSRKLRNFLGLERGDKVLCPLCDQRNCDVHFSSGNEIWIEKAGKGEEFLYAFQAPGLIGSDGTDRLSPWAPLVIGRETLAWPREIVSMEVDGKDVTNATCGVEVLECSYVKVVLRR